MDKNVDVAIIGAGSAGLAALSVVKQHTSSYILIDGGELGTTCARVGCMPSKGIIQIADDIHRRVIFKREGITGGDSLALDIETSMEHVRDLRDIFVDRVLADTTDNMGDEFITGSACFISANTLQVNEQRITAKNIIIATGSRPIIPTAWQQFQDRILTTDNFFELKELPKSIAVIGLGVIGLELGQALHRLGVQITAIDQQNALGGVTDPVVNKTIKDIISKEFPLWLGEAAEINALEDKLEIKCGERSVTVEKILVCIGREPNLETLNLEALSETPNKETLNTAKLNIVFDKNGAPKFNPHTMQIGKLPVYIVGDATGSNAILHEATHEGRVAGHNATHDEITSFKRKTPLNIIFSDPNIASIGLSYTELDKDQVIIGEMPLGPVGRALIMGRNRGIVRVYADRSTGCLMGAALIAPQGEHLAHTLAWAIEQNLTVFDLLKMPFYHPTIEETLQAVFNNIVLQMEVKNSYPLDLSKIKIKGDGTLYL